MKTNESSQVTINHNLYQALLIACTKQGVSPEAFVHIAVSNAIIALRNPDLPQANEVIDGRAKRKVA